MIAKKMITINWMKPSTPTAAQWLQKVKHVCTMEYMTAQLQLKMPIFRRRWTQVIDCLGWDPGNCKT